MAKKNVMTRAKKQKAFEAFQQQRLPEARQLLEKVCQKDKTDVESYFLLAIINGMLGQNEQAEKMFRHVIKLMPSNADAYNNLGLTLEGQGRSVEALECFQKACALHANEADYLYNLGNSLASLERYAEAETSYRQALLLQAGNIEALVNLGNVLHKLRRFDEAIELFEQAIVINPNFAEAYYNLGNALKSKSQMDDAEEAYSRALQIRPDYAEAWNNIAGIFISQSKVAEAISAHQKKLEIRPDDNTAFSSILFTQNYLPDISEQQKFEGHLEFARRFAGDNINADRKYTNDCNTSRRLKIGYVSSDLRRHPVATFFEPLLRHHDADAFETFAYSNSAKKDSVTERLAGRFHQWRDIYNLKDAQVVELIKQDEIDILVDMTGHTADNRLLVFASKPAPVQVTWLGYGGTTGLPTVDYRITDIYTNPKGPGDQFHTETLLRLPETFCCYQPPEAAPDVSELPARKNGYVTFGSFNNPAKLNDQVVKLWSDVLNAVEDSRLLLKSKSLTGEATQKYIQQRFAEHGVQTEQLVFEGFESQYLNSYNQIDIALDPTPYNGGTTSFDSCWMGVPVITLKGDHFYSRMGVSINRNLDLDDLIAQNNNDYIHIARSLAADLDRLGQLRKDLRKRMQNSPLTDAVRFAQHMETAFQKMWQAWCKHQAEQGTN